jgi:hypothetical protein
MVLCRFGSERTSLGTSVLGVAARAAVDSLGCPSQRAAMPAQSSGRPKRPAARRRGITLLRCFRLVQPRPSPFRGEARGSSSSARPPAGPRRAVLATPRGAQSCARRAKWGIRFTGVSAPATLDRPSQSVALEQAAMPGAGPGAGIHTGPTGPQPRGADLRGRPARVPWVSTGLTGSGRSTGVEQEGLGGPAPARPGPQTPCTLQTARFRSTMTGTWCVSTVARSGLCCCPGSSRGPFK